ncbi:RNA-binding motif protein, X-linked 2 isoform X1 [Gambusia affinis]|uniref:RNA-binding motif protein, X-linked 2 isoform X1 n=1 Tax=Gambusia affinis TaxID=33528 RepID=UPI000F2FD6D1|nr:RNA-binding motif protein, X-linked 2 isoform X1 [Gambusia affinis]
MRLIPLTKVKLINELNEREADLGIKEAVSWHSEYRDSAWIFVGGFPYELTEGDLICVFSQYGEIVNINLVRDKKTGKSKGFCFVCYEDQRSTILAVDNFNGIKIKGRTIRVDHVKNYRPPKDHEDIDDITKRLREDGCAPSEPAAAAPSEEDEQQDVPVKKAKKDKKEKKKKKKEKKEKKKKKSRESSSSTDSSPHPPAAIRVKEEKQDAAYDKYNHQGVPERVRDREDMDREMDRREDRDNRDRRRDDRETERRARDVRDRETDRRRDDGKRREERREEDREDRWRDREDSRRRDRDIRRRETERR